MTQTKAPNTAPDTVLPNEPRPADPCPALARLEHEGVLGVSGADAARFLQGQITCDVNALPIPASVPGARCNPKGRMQSSFRLLRTAEHEYLLAMSAELVERQRLELAKYAAFFKAQLRDDSARWTRLGLWGEGATAALDSAGFDTPGQVNAVAANPAGFVVMAAPDTFELWLERETADAVILRLDAATQPARLEDWLLRCIRLGHGQVTELTYESFIPQMLNLQQLSGVSFRKGCYTGQEIVARMQYLGTLKRRMYRLQSDSAEPPAAGTTVVAAESGRTVGEVVMAARSPRGSELLAVLQKDAAQSLLSLADVNGPSLTRADLPYESELTAQEAASEQSSRD